MRSADITFVILTRDEAADIGDSIASLPAGSKILVYDAESSDATRAIAAERGAQVVVAPWSGFVEARLSAARLVETTWTFMLDADERLSRALVDELLAIDEADDVSGYSMPRRNVVCGRWIRGAGWWPDRLVRLFRSGRARLESRAGGLHERWRCDGRTQTLRAPIVHLSYPTLAEYRRKFAAYTGIEAGGRRSSLARVAGAWLLFPIRAAWLYGARGGILDGWQGAYVSAASAAYPAVVETKAWRRSHSTRG